MTFNVVIPSYFVTPWSELADGPVQASVLFDVRTRRLFCRGRVLVFDDVGFETLGNTERRTRQTDAQRDDNNH